jgi:aminomethyltransferase
LGYEIYLRDGSKGDALWEKIMAAGQAHGLKPGHTSSIRRIEGAMLSYHADADINTNPYEVELGRLVDLEMDADFVGKEALKTIHQTGVSRQLIGIEFDGAPLTGPNTTFWQISAGDQVVGKVTSAVYSPRLQKNIALAMVSTAHTNIGTQLVIDTKSDIRNGVVCEKPFFDPRKKLASS